MEKNLNLDYTGYEDYLLERIPRTHPLGAPGVQYIFKFPNNFGASVIKFKGSYGYEGDLWELAKLWFTDKNNPEKLVQLSIYDLYGGEPYGCLEDWQVRNLLKMQLEKDEIPLR